MGPTNRSDHKLDHLRPRYCPGGVFRAEAREADDLWDCDLLTTEGSPEAFEVRTGDVIDARITLPSGRGAWPAIWTWRDGGNEIDVFEYHPDNPGTLELSNHVKGGYRYWQDPTVTPGATVGLRVVLGARTVEWYVGGHLVHADGRGVGRTWHAYLIVNLSVSDGTYHGPPPDGTPLSWACPSLKVSR
ncbi:hypothetical protein GCM10010193_64260 [Kitasatospora atroaurantiaca]|uniref:Glycosyl hydrolase family 16 n=2 Tax=Kitasatospora atroaurantiaca TaxID=285545 RepID=A0A561F1M0_9ACTN|nr:glycosyl hydrolase family 16 [Kitasatospora atroaurantiaca]